MNRREKNKNISYFPPTVAVECVAFKKLDIHSNNNLLKRENMI